MARPRKDNADYFSHDTNMRNHRKILALRTKFGLTGYAVWNMLLEHIVGSDGFVCEFNDREIMILSGDFGIEESKFKEIINFLQKFGMINLEGELLRSEGVNERMLGLVQKREQMRDIANKRRGNEENNSSQRNVSHKIRKFIKERDVVCKECGKSVDLEIDHIIPLHKGGDNSINNLQLLCMQCHSIKTSNAYAMHTHTTSIQSKVKESKGNEIKEKETKPFEKSDDFSVSQKGINIENAQKRNQVNSRGKFWISIRNEVTGKNDIMDEGTFRGFKNFISDMSNEDFKKRCELFQNCRSKIKEYKLDRFFNTFGKNNIQDYSVTEFIKQINMFGGSMEDVFRKIVHPDYVKKVIRIINPPQEEQTKLSPEKIQPITEEQKAELRKKREEVLNKLRR